MFTSKGHGQIVILMHRHSGKWPQVTETIDVHSLTHSLTHSGDSVILLCRERWLWGLIESHPNLGWSLMVPSLSSCGFRQLLSPNLCVLLHEVCGGAVGVLCRHNDVMSMAPGRVSNSREMFHKCSLVKGAMEARVNMTKLCLWRASDRRWMRPVMAGCMGWDH